MDVSTPRSERSDALDRTVGDSQPVRPGTTLPAAVEAMHRHRWVENLFAFLPLVFARELFHAAMVARSVGAFLALCLASSAASVHEDLVDVDADRAHPVKRTHPIASGALPTLEARILVAALVAGAIRLAIAVSPTVAALVAAHLALNAGYNFGWRRVPFLDVACIACGFVLEVATGAAAISVGAPRSLLVVTFALACALGFGQRMREWRLAEKEGGPRADLPRYDVRALARWLAASVAATVFLYALYTLAPSTTAYVGSHWLVPTTLFVIVGAFRFFHLAKTRGSSARLAEDMLRDRSFRANLALWALSIVGILYAG